MRITTTASTLGLKITNLDGYIIYYSFRYFLWWPATEIGRGQKRGKSHVSETVKCGDSCCVWLSSAAHSGVRWNANQYRKDNGGGTRKPSYWRRGGCGNQTVGPMLGSLCKPTKHRWVLKACKLYSKAKWWPIIILVIHSFHFISCQ